jgi:hypothetical protein
MNLIHIDIDQDRADDAAIERLTAENVVALSSHRKYRQRDFGVGYGDSSGYGFDKRYTSDWGNLRFRCR